MSVINQMLRNLDQPLLAGAARHGAPASLPQTGLLVGTSTVAPSKKPVNSGFSKKSIWPVFGLTLGGVVSLIWWTQQPEAAVLPKVVPQPMVRVEPAAASIQPVAIEPLVKSIVGPLAAELLAQPMALTMAALIENPPQALARPVRKPEVITRESSRNVVTQPEVADATPAAPLPMPARAPNTRAQEVAAIAPPALASIVPGVTTPIAPVRRELSALEITAQAQRLWLDGSRDPAITLLRDGLARAPISDVIPIVRELARMELAEGQTRHVLELLQRLEPAIVAKADLWAVRANAAQRLGLHQEAIDAYQKALAIQSGEPRWMLGAAVSLAATSQLGAAKVMAEKARAVGPISGDVTAYLRQLGVAI